MKTCTLSSGGKISYLGPTLDAGPLPALIYFTMSHRDSLQNDPYTQAILPLLGAPVRIFSWDLPYHPPGIEQNEGIRAWEEAHHRGEDFMSPFVSASVGYLEELASRNALIPGAVISSGLSRGAFAAFHLAAATDLINGVMAFAPLIRFHSLNLEHAIPSLAHRWVQGCIGFHDERVHTEHVVHFFTHIAGAAKKQRVKEPDIKLTLYPSIGLKGHGTPEDIFVSGGQAILKRLTS